MCSSRHCDVTDGRGHRGIRPGTHTTGEVRDKSVLSAWTEVVDSLKLNIWNILKFITL